MIQEIDQTVSLLLKQIREIINDHNKNNGELKVLSETLQSVSEIKKAYLR